MDTRNEKPGALEGWFSGGILGIGPFGQAIVGSGNQKSPDQLDLGVAGFVYRLDSKALRGALGLQAPAPYIGDGKPGLICGSAICREKFTLFRLAPLEYSSAGTSSHCGYVCGAGTEVGIRIFLKMKLGLRPKR